MILTLNLKIMKKVILVLVMFLFSSNAFAINFKDSLKQISNGSSKEINKNLDKKINSVLKGFEDKVDGYKKELDSEIAKYKEQIKEAEASLNKLKNLKARAEGYIKMAKIVIAVLSSGILVLIFIMWRIWRNVVTMKKVIKNVASYNEIEARLKKVEKTVGLK